MSKIPSPLFSCFLCKVFHQPQLKDDEASKHAGANRQCVLVHWRAEFSAQGYD